MFDTVFGFLKNSINEAMVIKFYSLALRVVFCGAIFIILLQAVKYFKKFLRKTFKRLKVDDGIAGFLTSSIAVGIYILVGFIVAQWLGIDAASIVALLGSAGVTVGLAIQGSLSNIAGGVLILILKPFKVGDYIIENNKMNEGTVTEIGLIYTKLVTLDNKTVILPNGSLANTSIVNVTQTPFRLIDMKFDIAYSADTVLAKNLIREVLENDEAVLKEKPIEVAMESWESSSVKLCSRFYVLNENFRVTKYRVLENVKTSFDKNNIEIPFPQVVVHNADDHEIK
ncbi:MAG: mechanosensitive ion channel [Lachnospiraceae bacterium]|nr:mechanosensitive ion channel [Lachnospiraceae bacterium]